VYYNPTWLSHNDIPSKRICRSSDDIIGALISGEKAALRIFIMLSSEMLSSERAILPASSMMKNFNLRCYMTIPS
jgi:hypothetical protein